ncbi:MAG: helix-turn-helix domain-containing protein [Saprospiraceae bacterium]
MPDANLTFADRLLTIRRQRGYSLQVLANRMGNYITRQALHRYELGQTRPDSDSLRRLCEALQVRPDFFFRERQVVLGNINFRKIELLHQKEQDRIRETALDFLERYLELENLAGIEGDFVNPLPRQPISSVAAVEQAAALLREAWNMGDAPISNVIETLEDLNVKLLEIEADDGFSGLSAWVGQTPVIVLNQTHSNDRKRFTALHELAHLLLEFDVQLPEKEQEQLCNAFAAALLIPAGRLRKELGENRRLIFLHEFGLLKRQYGVSIQALAIRAKTLGIISEHQLTNFRQEMKAADILKKEPEQYDFHGEEKSNRFLQLLLRAVAEEAISLSKAAALNNQKLAEFRQLFNPVKA